LFLFVFQFLLKYVDQLVGKGLDNWVVIQLIVLNLAWMLVLAVPMGLLFSTLMAFGSMGAALEITVIKSSGGSLVSMMLPMLISGLVLSFGLFWLNDYVLPDVNLKARALFTDIKKKKPTLAIEAGQFTSQLDT
jgi:lipopolysaccharide export system permease protein